MAAISTSRSAGESSSSYDSWVCLCDWIHQSGHRLVTGPPCALLTAFFPFPLLRVAFAALARALVFCFCALIFQAYHLSFRSKGRTVIPFFAAASPISQLDTFRNLMPLFLVDKAGSAVVLVPFTAGTSGGAASLPTLFAVAWLSRKLALLSLIGAAYIPSRRLVGAFCGVGRMLRFPSRSSATPM